VHILIELHGTIQVGGRGRQAALPVQQGQFIVGFGDMLPVVEVPKKGKRFVGEPAGEIGVPVNIIDVAYLEEYETLALQIALSFGCPQPFVAIIYSGVGLGFFEGLAGGNVGGQNTAVGGLSMGRGLGHDRDGSVDQQGNDEVAHIGYWEINIAIFFKCRPPDTSVRAGLLNRMNGMAAAGGKSIFP
jgi:hypothetical protein